MKDKELEQKLVYLEKAMKSQKALDWLFLGLILILACLCFWAFFMLDIKIAFVYEVLKTRIELAIPFRV